MKYLLIFIVIINLINKYNGHSIFELSKHNIFSNHENLIVKSINKQVNSLIGQSQYINTIRGGKTVSVKKLPKKNKKKSILATIKEQLNKIYPATRIYLLLSLFCTIIHLIGLPAPALFSLDKSKLYQLWRPFTSVAYLGSPSMSMANSLYFLVRYGQSLESIFGTGSHIWFLLIEIVVLSILGYLLGFPYLAQSMIAATVYVSANLNPLEKMPFQFGFVITSWQLPYCLMFIDMLSQQSVGAAWPHLLGIFAGHFYHFYTNIWPQLGGREIIKTPKWLINKFNTNPIKNKDKKSSSKSKKLAKGTKGRKLGTSTKINN